MQVTEGGVAVHILSKGLGVKDDNGMCLCVGGVEVGYSEKCKNSRTVNMGILTSSKVF